ncbi:hypothetical protein [Effusibacillus pohliae]|uniref:hypothetical protein n=1 Tax=Effusibacillus pohliae TaxID=232270 RepID=UPI00038189F0|nr:hypothetical protein [Effusibacillus pohliae]
MKRAVVSWLLTVAFFLSGCASGSIHLQGKNPEEVVRLYYETVNHKQYESLPYFFSDSFGGSKKADDIRKKLNDIDSMEIIRVLGTQIKDDLAHVHASVRVKDRNTGRYDYNFAQYDLIKQNGEWRFVSIESLDEGKQKILLDLWKQQKQLVNSDETVREHVRWIEEQRRKSYREAIKQEPVPVSE